MLTEERREKILEILEKQNSVTISELEKAFKVSNETLRRDLLSLENRKKLIRVHGGAIKIKSGGVERGFDVRINEYTEQKHEISEQAIGFISEGDVIAIDSGSTAVLFCKLLVGRFKKLTIVTSSLILLEILSQNVGFRIILCSGEYDRESRFFLGDLTTESFKRLHISKAFFCPTAISLKHGLTDFNERYIQVDKAILSVSDKCFIIADSSKFETTGLYKWASLDSDMTVITDKNLSDEIYNKYLSADIDIVRG